MSKTESVSKPARGGEQNSAPATQRPARRLAQRTRRKTEASAARAASIVEPSKTARILKLLRRKKGASIGDLQDVTGWQAHSVRGFLSGTVKKRLGLRLQSERAGKGGRQYLTVEA